MQATNITVKRDEKNWEAEVQADISAEVLTVYGGKALKNLQREAHLDGFRPGKAPEAVVRAKVGEAAILREAAELAVRDMLPEIFAKESLPIVDTPQVTTSVPEAGKPLHFTARAPLAPQITLPDYKKIAAGLNADKKAEPVTDEEHAETLTHFRRERARIEKIDSGTDPKEAAEHARALAAAELPALDDEFVKPFGYETATAFEGAVRENLQNEKAMREAETHRTAILDAVLAKTEVKYPAILREYEIEEMEHRMSDDLARMGTTLEKYMTQTKKTHEDLHKDWEPAADKRAKTRLILAEIARKESIEADQGDLQHQIEHAKKQYPNVDGNIIAQNLSHSLRNQAVIQWLEEQKA